MAKKKKSYKPEEAGILLEDIRDQVSAVAEQHLTTDKKIDGLCKKVDILTERVDKVDNKVNILTERIVKVSEDVEIIKLDIEFIKNDLKSKVDRNEFTVLERRVALLENRR